MFVLVFIITIAILVILRSIWMLAKGDKAWYFSRKGIYGEIPISIAIILFAISTFSSLKDSAAILRFSSFVFGMGGILLNLFTPSLLKPPWLRWLEQEHRDILHLLRKDAREKGFRVWAEQVKTQEELEFWTNEVRQKYKGVPIPPPPNTKVILALIAAFILLFATVVILFPSNRPNPDIYVSETFMCNGFDSKNLPSGKTSIFHPNVEEIYLCAYLDPNSPMLEGKKDKTLTFTIDWYGPNSFTYNHVTTKAGWFYTQLASNGEKLPSGKYKVQILAGKAIQQTVEFEVISEK